MVFFQRVCAQDLNFEQKNFDYTVFDNSYFRNCTFLDCSFTGCKFIGSNFRGSKFRGCDFRYAIFERTIITETLLDTSFPSEENLQLSLARTLRLNFQSLGDNEAVNKAIGLELAAKKVYLKKSWNCNEGYYHRKYEGWLSKTKMFLKWLNFVIMDALWGNGENFIKLFRSTVFILAIMSIIHIVVTEDKSFSDFVNIYCYMPEIFFGLKQPSSYHGSYLTLITITRFGLFGLGMSILVKRLSKR